MSDELVVDEVGTSLWLARRAETVVAARTLTPDEGFGILRRLVERAVAGGDEVVGWKIARLPGENGAPFVFAAPVFSSSLVPDSYASLLAPKLEVELVARVVAADPTWTMSWHVGLEIVDNHDPAWPLAPGWAIADWGLHAGAVLGDQCRPPVEGEAFQVTIQTADESTVLDGNFRTGHAELVSILERDCPRVARPCQPGDLVWTGSLIPPLRLPRGGDLVASVAGLGSTTLASS